MRLKLLFCFCLWFSIQAKAQQIVAPADWQPSLSFVRQALETQVKEAKTQQTLSRLAGCLMEVAEAELFLVYVQLCERSSVAQRAALRREQRHWLRERDIHEADMVVIGPQPTAKEKNDATIQFVQFIDQRAEELRARLSRLRQRHH